ncbi:hypothetical protein [Mucilaginibacter lappiensis]|jgi:hypothetical protein|uniref:hypothetical protein n=1 Tax=Mucilaginibacter lappiensis TaxID=354630 RepID=UPI003D1F550F
MAKEDRVDLLKLISPFSDEVQNKALWLRDFVWSQYPQANELIFDNHDNIILGWSPTEKVGHASCVIALDRTNNNIYFGFYDGAALADPEKLLTGNGKRYRYIQIEDINDFPKAYITQLLKDAWINSLRKVNDYKQIVNGKTVVKSILASLGAMLETIVQL